MYCNICGEYPDENELLEDDFIWCEKQDGGVCLNCIEGDNLGCDSCKKEHPEIYNDCDYDKK